MALFVYHLTHVDSSVWCPERGLIGASWNVHVELDGQLGEDGMLFDFGEVKPWIKSRLDDGIDHTLIVPTEAPGISISDCPEGICIRTTEPYDMEVRGPRQAFTLFPWKRITPEALAIHLSTEMMRRPPARVDSITLTLEEERIDGAAYTYTHGLKRHAGNCQRIAHGHRSRLHVIQQGQRQAALETRYADWLSDSYLVAAEDIVAEGDRGDWLRTAYQSAQGQFSLTLPTDRCRILPTSTTVENIAAWLAGEVAQDTGTPTRIRAFEGVHKGATAEV
ncbi:6-carboxytetrahydropterin synthase [Halomonas binhaiensis]|uniref:6-carboxy-5,6,7,8-tetrahydropterin synthase n=1 Tax=Halomonas binhaiensis TaxID=2562282 RepID=A0A5C1NGJ1_9GAMM|nr:6-carboxytetrahydropterin synthase [Halomonas binhaiensis]QEM81981.1 6-carboxytetrahydropterin synthase [Halomonas binhaiensis]